MELKEEFYKNFFNVKTTINLNEKYIELFLSDIKIDNDKLIVNYFDKQFLYVSVKN